MYTCVNASLNNTGMQGRGFKFLVSGRHGDKLAYLGDLRVMVVAS